MLQKILYLLMIVSMAGCLATPTSVPQNYVNQTSTPSLQPETNSTPTNTKTSTAVPTVSPTIQGDANLSVRCINITGDISAFTGVKNSIVFATQENPKQVFLWNTQLIEKNLVGDTQNLATRDFSTSSDGKWLAYLQSDLDDNRNTLQDWLIIMSPDGKLYKKISIDIGLEVSRWFDEERLLLTRGFSPKSTQIVLNPFTGLQQELTLEFSDLYDSLPVTNWDNIAVYNSSLTQVVYAGTPADIVLADVKSKKVVARISPAPVVHSIPKWSPNGQQLIVAYADILSPINDSKHWKFELYNISWDGKFNQLTNLSIYYDYPRIPSYTWSPNGQYIAFWLETNPLQNPGVFDFSVLDLDTKKVVNYCVKTRARGIPKLFWSPDSKNVVFETFDRSDEKTNRVVLVDITQDQAVQISEKLTPLGWMLSP